MPFANSQGCRIYYRLEGAAGLWLVRRDTGSFNSLIVARLEHHPVDRLGLGVTVLSSTGLEHLAPGALTTGMGTHLTLTPLRTSLDDSTDSASDFIEGFGRATAMAAQHQGDTTFVATAMLTGGMAFHIHHALSIELDAGGLFTHGAPARPVFGFSIGIWSPRSARAL